jgi:hypothetical protein
LSVSRLAIGSSSGNGFAGLFQPLAKGGFGDRIRPGYGNFDFGAHNHSLLFPQENQHFFLRRISARTDMPKGVGNQRGLLGLVAAGKTGCGRGAGLASGIARAGNLALGASGILR